MSNKAILIIGIILSVVLLCSWLLISNSAVNAACLLGYLMILGILNGVKERK